MSRNTKLMIVVGIAYITLLCLAVALFHPTAAQSQAQPQWTSLAGSANHMCYTHGGIKQIVYSTVGGGAGSQGQEEGDVVCMDNWAYNLSNWTFQP